MPAKPLIFRIFQAERGARRTFRVGVGSVATLGQVQEKARDVGIGLAWEETHKICEAADGEAGTPPYGGTFLGIARTAPAIRPREAAAPAPRSKSRAVARKSLPEN
jgi:hypothetical protein